MVVEIHAQKTLLLEASECIVCKLGKTARLEFNSMINCYCYCYYYYYYTDAPRSSDTLQYKPTVYNLCTRHITSHYCEQR